MNSSQLITASDLASVTAQVDLLVANIEAHRNLSLPVSHGNITVVDEAVYDNSSTPFDDSPNSPIGNKVGTVTLQIVANGQIYSIPASLSLYGPPRVGTITQQLNTEAFSFAPEGGTPPSVTVTCEFTASQATVVTWEVYVGSAWVSMNAIYYYFGGAQYSGVQSHSFKASTATFTFKNADGSSGTSTVTSGLVQYTTPSYTEPSAQTASLTMAFFSNDTTGKITLGKIRLKIDNSAIGGGIRYSGECTCTLEDQTGSWIVSAIEHPWTDLELKRLFRFKTWACKHQAYETSIYRGSLGRQLVERMGARFNESGLKEKVIAMLNSNMTMTQRYSTYRALIKECFKKYWPDCPNSHVQKELGNNDANV
jgi:hypothetical protein